MIDKIEFTAKTLHTMREFCYSLIIQRDKEYFKILRGICNLKFKSALSKNSKKDII